MDKKLTKSNSKKSEVSKLLWNKIDEFYKLNNQDERLEFILKIRNEYYGK